MLSYNYIIICLYHYIIILSLYYYVIISLCYYIIILWTPPPKKPCEPTGWALPENRSGAKGAGADCLIAKVDGPG